RIAPEINPVARVGGIVARKIYRPGYAVTGGGHFGIVDLDSGVVLYADAKVDVVFDAAIVNQHAGIAGHPNAIGPVSAGDVANRDETVFRRADDDARRVLAHGVAHVTLEHGVNVRVDARRGFERDVAVSRGDAYDFGEDA